MGTAWLGAVSLAVDPGPALVPATVTVGHGRTATLTTLIASLVTPGLIGDIETLTAVSSGRGQVVLGANNAVTYVAPVGGTDTLTYTVIDQLGDVATGSVAVTVDPGPVTVPGTLKVGHGVSTNVSAVLKGLVTPGLPGDTETLTAVVADKGQVTLTPGGAVTYAPPASGGDTLTYTVTDQYGDTATGDVVISVDPGPQLTTTSLPAKLGHGQAVQVATVIGGLAGDTLALSTTMPGRGSLSLANGVITYTAPGTGGVDSVSYTITDQLGEAVTSTVSLAVDGGPITTVGILKVGHGQTSSLTTLIAGLIAPGLSGDTETVTAVSAARGTVSLVGGGVVSYVAPAAGGPDTVTYTVRDQLGDTATGTVAVSVDPGPSTTVGSAKVGHGATANLTSVIAGFVTPGLVGDTETVTAVSALKGKVTLGAGGIVSYVAPVSGSDTLTYTVKDQFGETASGTLAVAIDPGPAATAGTLTIGHGLTANVTALVTGLVRPGLAGDTETITAAKATTGSSTLAGGVLSYTAPASGTDTLTYTVTDQLGETATSTVKVTVDSGPKITAATPAKVGHGQTVQVGTVAPGLAGDALTLAITSPGQGALVLAAGKLSYTAANAGGPDTIGYTVTDQYGDVASGTLSTLVDAGPVAAAGKVTVGHGQTASLTTLVSSLVTPGLAGDTKTITAVTAAAGTATLASGGAISYLAPASGTDTVTYTVKDQLGDIATGTVTVTVDPGPIVVTAIPAKIGHGQSVQVGSVTPGLAGDALTLTTTAAGAGKLALAGGVLTYTAPVKGGADSIGYTIKDGFGDAVSGTIAVTVDGGPIVAAGSLKIGHGQPASLTSLVAGLITPGLAADTETITAVTATKGQVTLGAGGAISYVAPVTGPDSVTFTVEDQLGDLATGTVAVSVDAGPTAKTASVAVKLGTTTDLTAAILAAVTAGLAGDTLNLVADSTTGTLGSVSLAGGAIGYTASGAGLRHIAANGSLRDSFTYTVSDQLGDTATGTVNLTVSNPATIVTGPAGGGGVLQATATASVVNAAGLNNMITSTGGNDLVNAGSGQAKVYVNTGDVVVKLAGSGNLVQGFNLAGTAGSVGADGNVSVSGSTGTTTVKLGNGQDTITLGGSSNVISLGSGNSTITLTGQGNTVTFGAGTDTLNATKGDTIMLNGTTLALKGGLSEMVFLGAGTSSLDDLSSGTTVTVSKLSGSASILDVAKDPGFVLSLTGGAGGFTTVASVVAALQSDGHGGTQLSLGSGLATIDFVNASISLLSPVHFRVG